MVGNDTDRYVRVIILLIFHARDLAHSRPKRQHRIHIEDRIHILYDARQSLKPHTGIDVFLRKLRIIAVSVIIELGKYVIPDLHIAVAVTAYGTAGLTAAVFLTSVIVNLRTGTAGA